MASLLTSAPEFGFSSDDLDRLVAMTFVEQIEYHREIGSTNDRALQLAGESAVQLPLLVLAGCQTAGRGRGANRWWAESGALTFSLLLPAAAYQLPPSRWPQVGLTVGLAVTEAIEDLVGDPQVQIKWPNDVYLRGRKVSGILVEVPRQSAGKLVIGIGLNVNNDVSAAPADVRALAIALCEVLGSPLPLSLVLTRVLLRIAERLNWIGTGGEELRARWRQRCLLTGQQVHLQVGGREVAGFCRGIDDEGALVIETNEGVEHCFAGVVMQVGA